MPEPNDPELALRGTDSFTYAFYRHDPQRADHFDVHYHGEYEIIYVPKGSFHYLAGGADYWLRPGEALFLDQYSIHAFLEPAQPCGSYQGILFGKKFLFPSDTNPACRQFYEEIPPQRFSLTQKLTGATPWQQEILAPDPPPPPPGPHPRGKRPAHPDFPSHHPGHPAAGAGLHPHPEPPGDPERNRPGGAVLHPPAL